MILLLRLFCIWAVVWPLVTFGLKGLDRLPLRLSFSGRTLLVTAIMVPLISLVIVPTVHRLVRPR